MFVATFASAQKKNFSGIITDQKTGETLVGATVVIKVGYTKGTTTNGNGFFSISGIDQQVINVEYSFVGYETISKTYDLNDKSKLFVEVRLKPSEVLLGQVTAAVS